MRSKGGFPPLELDDSRGRRRLFYDLAVKIRREFRGGHLSGEYERQQIVKVADDIGIEGVIHPEHGLVRPAKELGGRALRREAEVRRGDIQTGRDLGLYLQELEHLVLTVEEGEELHRELGIFAVLRDHKALPRAADGLARDGCARKVRRQHNTDVLRAECGFRIGDDGGNLRHHRDRSLTELVPTIGGGDGIGVKVAVDDGGAIVVQRGEQALIFGKRLLTLAFAEDAVDAGLLHPPIGDDIAAKPREALVRGDGLIPFVLDGLTGRVKILHGARGIVVKVQTAIPDDLLVVDEEANLVVAGRISEHGAGRGGGDGIPAGDIGFVFSGDQLGDIEDDVFHGEDVLPGPEVRDVRRGARHGIRLEGLVRGLAICGNHELDFYAGVGIFKAFDGLGDVPLILREFLFARANVAILAVDPNREFVGIGLLCAAGEHGYGSKHQNDGEKESNGLSHL
ncbi:hypothetical protein SDC9_86928 [bioreactor metagenome]|uniref:Uncharacterized protein n=1 Tax=bioreactor metagenome TaxID=1076179 RepID=A0A644ZIY1_9ZZZZ